MWLDIAEDDLETAEYCYHGKRYLWSLFMCQQSIEKAIKAVFFEKTGKVPPRKHDLISLAGVADVLRDCDENTQDLFRHLSLFYIETRYPDKRIDLEAECMDSLNLMGTGNKNKPKPVRSVKVHHVLAP